MNAERTPGRWPNYAKWALEETVADLLEIEQLTRQALEALRDNDLTRAVILLGDIRNVAMDGRNTLRKGKDGER